MDDRPDGWTPFDEFSANVADHCLVELAREALKRGDSTSDTITVLMTKCRAMHPRCPHRRTLELTNVSNWIARQTHLDGLERKG